MGDSEKKLLALQTIRRKDRKQATTRRRRQGEQIPNRLSDLLNTFFGKDPEALAQIEQNKAIDAWARLVGDSASRVSKATRLRHGTLTVVVNDPMWMQELSLMKHSILAKYHSEFPGLKVRDIYFTRYARASTPVLPNPPAPR